MAFEYEEVKIDDVLFNRFVDGHIAINCRTRREAYLLLNHCAKHGVTWAGNGTPGRKHHNYNRFEQDTCYSVYNFNGKKLEYDGRAYYETLHQYEVVYFDTLIMEE